MHVLVSVKKSKRGQKNGLLQFSQGVLKNMNEEVNVLNDDMKA